MKKIAYPWLERSYGEGLKNQYDHEHTKKFVAWLSSQAEHAERGYVKYNDIDELVYDEFTEDDKERVKERLIANIETMNRNRKELNESRGWQLQRERGKSPKQVLEEMLQNVEDIDDLVIVFTDRDADVDMRFSCDNTLEILGMLEVAKSDTAYLINVKQNESKHCFTLENNKRDDTITIQ